MAQPLFRRGRRTLASLLGSELRGLATVSSPSTPPGGSTSLFVTNVTGVKGNSPVLIGLMEYFKRHVPSVGFFMPVGTDPMPHSDPPVPKHVALLQQHFNLAGSARSMYGVTLPEAQALLAAGRTSELTERVWSAYDDYRRGKELVIVEGATLDGVANQAELNGRFAAELGAPVLMIVDQAERERPTAADLVNRALIARQDLLAEHADVLGVVLNRVNPRDHALIVAQAAKRLAVEGLPFAGGIPADAIISAARLNEVAAGLEVRLLYGDPDDLDADIGQVMVCSQAVPHFLEKLDALNRQRKQAGLTPARPLVLTTKDRADVLLSLAAAHSCGAGPNIAGLLMCDAGMAELTTPTDRILSCLSDHLFPVLEVDAGLFSTATRVAAINAGILPTSTSKIKHATDLFQHYIDPNVVASQLALPHRPKLTPAKFKHNIDQICRADPQHIVLPEATDKRVLAAAAEATHRGIARITLLGKPAEVEAAARRFNCDISGATVLDFASCPQLAKYAEALAAARAAKGVTREHALDMLSDVNMFGTMMVACGDADGMVSGATCTTANTIRPALQVLKTQDPLHPGRSALVSSVFFMCLEDRVLVYGDCAVNVDPTASELAQIAVTSADTAAAFGIEPRVAMLSYSTLGSGAGPAVDKVKEATQLVKGLRPDLPVEGPIQYDAAVDPVIAAQKVKGDSPVAGHATVCCFPDLNAGNATYKAVQQSTGAIAVGPLMQGLAKPVNDLSRGCTVADIVNTVACTAVQAIAAKRSSGVGRPAPAPAATPGAAAAA